MTTETKTYERFDRAFKRQTAYAILRAGKPVGRIALKYGASAQAYVQLWGADMQAGQATGYGYDKQSAAVESAVEKLRLSDRWEAAEREALGELQEGFAAANGERWTTIFEQAGYVLALVID